MGDLEVHDAVGRTIHRLAALLDKAAQGQDDAAAIKSAADEGLRLLSEGTGLADEVHLHLQETLQAVAARAEPPAALLDRMGRLECELAHALASRGGQ